MADKPLKLASLPRGTPFVSNERQLFIQKDSLSDMTPSQKDDLRNELQALLTQLSERSGE